MKQINKKYRNSTAVANTLARENVKIVYKVLYDRFNGMAHDTLISVGMSTLLDAAYKYDSTTDVKFTTYAYILIYYKILEVLKKEKSISDSVILSGDFSDGELMTHEIRNFLAHHTTVDLKHGDYDSLQLLSDLNMYEVSYEMFHQELKGGRNVKAKDFKQQKIIKWSDDCVNRDENPKIS